MVRKVLWDKKEAEDWMVIKAPTGPQDPREKWVTAAPQVHLLTSLTPP